MRTLVYVHGTNGSGKSTLARKVATAAGGFVSVHALPDNRKARFTLTRRTVMFAGAYGTACGGVDGIHPYSETLRVLRGDYSFFAEGLVTPGLETCQRMAGMFDQHLFIALATPLEQCVANVQARRDRAGNTKPYDPTNLYKKQRSVDSWGKRLAEAGLQVQFLTYREAYRASLKLLGLRPPNLKTLLE